MEVNALKYTVLVIEDNLGDFVLIQDYLEEHQPTPIILRATTFAEAADVLEKTSYKIDAILLDLSLPDKSGENLIEEILVRSKDIPVIVLTGYSDEKFAVKSLSLGIADYILKDELTAINIHKSIIYGIERMKSLAKIKTSEKRYSDLFQFTPFPIFICEKDTFKIVQANDKAIKQYGYSESELLDLVFCKLFVNENEYKKFNNYLKSEKSKPQFSDAKEFKQKTKKNKIIDVEIIVNEIQLEEDKKYFSIMINDITEKKQFEDKLTKAIINTQEEERFDIGSELHENVCQILAATKISLGMIKDEINGEAADWLIQSQGYIDMANKEIRSISHRLAPDFYENINLEEACLTLIKTFNPEDKYKVNFLFDNRIKELGLNRELQLNLYRILQEQLKNIIQYAKASTIDLEILVDDDNTLVMNIKDDGIGFDSEKKMKGIGLANMKRRSMLFQGDFTLESSPNNGCQISIEIPIKENVKEKIKVK
tara:strand:- start:76 stop:1524 length:1449 start_codon:yes stop_codon:yes gene_type:complete